MLKSFQCVQKSQALVPEREERVERRGTDIFRGQKKNLLVLLRSPFSTSLPHRVPTPSLPRRNAKKSKFPVYFGVRDAMKSIKIYPPPLPLPPSHVWRAAEFMNEHLHRWYIREWLLHNFSAIQGDSEGR